MSAAENIVPFPRPGEPELPHDIAVEQALIGAVLINNDACGLVPGIVSPQHFY